VLVGEHAPAVFLALIDPAGTVERGAGERRLHRDLRQNGTTCHRESVSRGGQGRRPPLTQCFGAGSSSLRVDDPVFCFRGPHGLITRLGLVSRTSSFSIGGSIGSI